MGGTFDPVHDAHLQMARVALERLAPRTLLFIPTGTTRYRAAADASAEHRVAMLRLALQGEPRFAIDTRELAAGASGYTADTLAELRAEHPSERLVLLLGADQFAKLATWHRPEQVRRLAEIAVFARPGWEVDAGRALMLPMPPSSISASEIRARVHRGEPVSHMVPPEVAAYIARHGLYL